MSIFVTSKTMIGRMERIQVLDSIEKVTCLHSVCNVKYCFVELGKEKSSSRQAKNHTHVSTNA